MGSNNLNDMSSLSGGDLMHPKLLIFQDLKSETLSTRCFAPHCVILDLQLLIL